MRLATLAAAAIAAALLSGPARGGPLLRCDGRLLVPQMPEPQRNTCKLLRSLERGMTELDEVIARCEAENALPLPLNPKELQGELMFRQANLRTIARCREVREHLRVEHGELAKSLTGGP